MTKTDVQTCAKPRDPLEYWSHFIVCNSYFLIRKSHFCARVISSITQIGNV